MSLELLSQNLAALPKWVVMIILAWSLAWKGVALWKASKKGSVTWFVAILIFNTMGILEILYIFLFSKIDLNKKEIKEEKTINKKKRR